MAYRCRATLAVLLMTLSLAPSRAQYLEELHRFFYDNLLPSYSYDRKQTNEKALALAGQASKGLPAHC